MENGFMALKIKTCSAFSLNDGDLCSDWSKSRRVSVKEAERSPYNYRIVIYIIYG
jgi:hypothetical protein